MGDDTALKLASTDSCSILASVPQGRGAPRYLVPETVIITFEVVETERAAARYHIPLLLGPFGYTTYRGS